VDQLICPNCGAPLPASAASQDVVTCQYCNITFRIPKSFTPEPDMGNLILGADFRQDNLPGWDFPNRDKVQFINGTSPELHFNYPAKNGLWYALNSSGFYDDVDASVSIRFYAGNEDIIDAGLVLRYRKTLGSYCILISPLGTYVVGSYEKGTGEGLEWKAITSWTKHTALRKGLNQINRLRVIIKGNRLRVYLNGVMATSLRDDRFKEGEIQLAAEASDKSSVEVGYSDLQIREVKA
jgi:hypothetical protein